MTKLEEIKKDAEGAEKLMQAIIQDFIDKHGLCDINITNELIFVTDFEGKKHIRRNKVNFKITI